MTIDNLTRVFRRISAVFVSACVVICACMFVFGGTSALSAPSNVSVSSVSYGDPSKGCYIRIEPDSVEDIVFYEIITSDGTVIKIDADGGTAIVKNSAYVTIRYFAAGEYSEELRLTLNSQTSRKLYDSASDISALIYDAASVPDNAAVSAYRIVSGDVYDSIIKKYMSLDQLAVFSLSLTTDGRKLDFGDNIQWTVPIPSFFTSPECRVWFVGEDGEMTQIECSQSDGYVSFVSDKTGIFYIHNDNGVHIGDVDGNGRIALADARLILRHCARLEVLEDKQVLSADVNRDGRVTLKDARLLIRYVASLEILDYLGGN